MSLVALIRPSAWRLGALPLGAVALLCVLLAGAVSIDPIRTGGGVKSDEATYVSMALSLAYDHDLAYERRDLQRFWGLYHQGPEGIFLKQGRRVSVERTAGVPWLTIVKRADHRADRLYFGKSLAYAVVAAPFVRVFGLNGFWVLHILLLAVAAWCGSRYLSATSKKHAAVGFTLAFLAVSVLPVHAVYFMPDLFNAVLVFVAYFLWRYKDVARVEGSWLQGRGSTLAAAVLLGVACYSKPTNAPLIIPIVLTMWWRRQWMQGVLTGAVFVLATGVLFGANAAVTGEFNYQGGDRKTFYGHFPFESTADVWQANTALVSTNDADAANVLEPAALPERFARNVLYFLLGRHFGFVPYFFPGVVALLGWLWSGARRDASRVFMAAGVAIAAITLLLFLPYTWSGGGGPPGNRYFLAIYPVLFFLLPSADAWHVLLAVAGGALFTAKMLMNPFVSAKNTWEIAERGFARRLPVELTMANDLPVMLAQPPRGHIPYGDGADAMLLYFLDAHAFPPELVGTRPDGSRDVAMWTDGGGRADIIVRVDRLMTALDVEAVAPVPTVVTLSAGSDPVVVTLRPAASVRVRVPARGVRGLGDVNYLFSTRSSEGWVPQLLSPGSRDGRTLGAQLRFRPVWAAASGS
mgnify:CR=1 FL=1